MIKPAVFAFGAALALASVAVAPGTASAQNWGPPGPPHSGGWGPGWGGPGPGPGWGGPGWGGPGWGGPRHGCRPVYRKVQVRGPWGWRWRTVQVGTRCYGPPRW